MKVMGIASGNLGTDNQIRGVVLAAVKKGENIPVTRNELLVSSSGNYLHPKKYENYDAFVSDVNEAIKCYLTENKAPEFVVLPLDQAALPDDNKDVDLMSRAIKEAFAFHGCKVKTMVIASNLYDYKNVDLIHVGKHLLSREDEKKLETNPQLKSKIVQTLGVPSNISMLSVNAAASQQKVKSTIDKYKELRKAGKKIALFSLGGKTDNGQIKFTIDDAKSLMYSASIFKNKGYEIVFINSPRTPNDVTDYLYDTCKQNGMDFYNSKKVATNEEERQNFRNYDGLHNDEFARENETRGNIYPAILSVCDFVVNTHDSFSYTSDAAAIGIPSVVYTGNEIDKEKRPDCYKLFEECSKRGHVIDLVDARRKVMNHEEIKTKPMDNVSSQLIVEMKKKLSRNLINHREILKLLNHGIRK